MMEFSFFIQFDEDQFEEVYEDFKWLASKRAMNTTETKPNLQLEEEKSIQIVKGSPKQILVF